MQMLLNKRIWLICAFVMLLITIAFCSKQVISEFKNINSQDYSIFTCYNNIPSVNNYESIESNDSKSYLTDYNEPSNYICKTNSINYYATMHYVIGFGSLLLSVFIIIFGIVYFCERTYKNK